MVTSTIKALNFKIVVFLFAIFLYSCTDEKPAEKINGLSLVASRDSLKKKDLTPILRTHANAISLMPYAFMDKNVDQRLIFNTDWQWFGETGEGTEHAIELLKKKKFQIMLKPHIWLRNGDFTGDLSFDSEAEWVKFESSYKSYILFYARLAEKHQVELLCIGTELFSFVDQRPNFWKELISQIRKVYSGKLVYAENWDKVNKVDLWSKLDFIGVDAYFPLSDKAVPTIDEIIEGWEDPKNLLDSISSVYQKPVLFTEYGYRNIDYSLKQPWNSDKNPTFNFRLQAIALKVLYEEVWNEDWFAGGFIWKWHQHKQAGGLENNMFTPQNKPAEKVLRKYYKKFSY